MTQQTHMTKEEFFSLYTRPSEDDKKIMEEKRKKATLKRKKTKADEIELYFLVRELGCDAGDLS